MVTATTARAMRRASDLLNVLYHAVAAFAGKRTVRDQLEDGESHQVDVRLRGTVDGQAVDEHITGRLNVGYASVVNGTAACDQAHLLGWLLSQFPNSRRERILKDLPALYDAHANDLPPIEDPSLLERSKKLLEQLRAKKESPRRGSVSFTPE